MTDNRGGEAPTPVREYQSIILTIDPHSPGSPRVEDGEIVQKKVSSSQGDTAALYSLFGYYGDTDLVLNPTTAELFKQAGIAGPNIVWVYHTKANTQIVLDFALYHELVDLDQFGGGSHLVATEKLVEIAADMSAKAANERGGIVPLMFFSVEMAPAEPDADPAPGVAASVLRNAEFEGDREQQ